MNKKLKFTLVSLISLICISLLIAVPTIIAKSSPKLKVHMIKTDTGRNDCFLIELPDGKKMLIDAGVDKSVVPQIQKYGITSLDYVIGTHQHGDHIGGMDSVLYTFPVTTGKIHYPKGSINATSSPYKAMSTAALTKKYTIEKHTTNDIIFDTAVNGKRLLCKVLGPVDSRVDGVGTDDYEGDVDGENFASLIFKIQYGDMAILFTGDGKIPAENDLKNAVPDELWAQVIKVAHHGITGDKTNQCSDAFLDLVKPQYALITNGDATITQYVKSNLQERNVTYWSTSSDGDVTLVSDGKSWWNEPKVAPAWAPTKK